MHVSYSQTGCSFDGNFANFRHNIGILIDSLSRASCSVHLVPRGKNWLRFSKMFQVLLQNFEDRFASFYVDEPLSNYQDLLDHVKKAVPFLQGIDDQQIVISYKDLSLQTFISIDRNESTREYSTNSTTSGVESVCSFQPGFPGKYVP